MSSHGEEEGNLHVAIIMDGNGRWAQRQGKNRLWGHQEGAKALKKIIRACPTFFIRYLTVYAFSSENWKRAPEEIQGLMKLFESYIRSETPELQKEGVRLKIIGDRSRLDPSLQDLILWAEDLTKDNVRFGLQVALNYGGQDEILHAIRTLASRVQDCTLRPQDITADHIAQSLWTYPWPDPDLLIRTGGEMRLSNYLLWQLSYTELIFFPQCWPDFTPEDLSTAIQTYKKRSRQFGGLPHLSSAEAL